jgi:SSS family solute:Na+ symporter
MAVVTGIYTIAGGLKAVIVTDVLQSVMMIIAAVIVAFLTFSTAEIGGWSGFRELDAAAGEAAKMHLYLPMNHPARPWTGMLTGLMILHFNYWGANQFIVQRALSARSDKEARIGIITAGFLKLLIPFLSIGTGVAAFYLFTERMPGQTFDGDTAFPMLMRQVVVPVGAGLVGLVAAGLVGAILSSIDSLLNSAATIITFDLHKRYLHPNASERELVLVGRISVLVFVLGAALLTMVVMEPNRTEHFYTYVAGQTAKLVTGIVVAFALGMFWQRATPAAGLAAIISGIVFSYGLTALYDNFLGANPAIAAWFGVKLNFFHGAAASALLAAVVHVVVSLCTQPDDEKSAYTWTRLGGHDPSVLKKTIRWLLVTLAVYAVLAISMVNQLLHPSLAGLLAAVWTFALFAGTARKAVIKDRESGSSVLGAVLVEDRVWAGLLSAIAVYMMFHFY